MPVSVLNAKRHQRLGQAGWGSEQERLLAWVLNAKRHQRLGQRAGLLPVSRNTRAQRQKASKVGTGLLNAPECLERQLCSTPKGIKGWDSRPCPRERAEGNKCSTPKGIKGWDSLDEPAPPVLG